MTENPKHYGFNCIDALQEENARLRAKVQGGYERGRAMGVAEATKAAVDMDTQEIRRLRHIARDLSKALESARKHIDEGIMEEQADYDSPPEPADRWSHDALHVCAEAVRALDLAREAGIEPTRDEGGGG